MKKYLVHIVWFVFVVGAFFGGMYFGKSSRTAGFAGARGGFTGAFASSTARGGFAGGAGGRGGAGGGFVAGTITSKDAQSITLQLANGNSEIVFYSSSTSVIKPSPASANDLTTGTMVMIGGMQNSDGSLTAQSIQVRQPMGQPTSGGQ